MSTGAREPRKVIIRKVIKVQPHAHHGGSWKVAYADFVTAMMAFFMVMWILGMSDEMRNSIQSYFSNPAGVQKGYSGGRSPLGNAMMPGGAGKLKLISRSVEREQLRAAGEKIQTRLRSSDGLREIAAQVEVVMTSQGLRIELVEDAHGDIFFASGDATVKPACRRALGVVAEELRATPQPLVIEGHTDAAPFGRPGYTNWELSADRANAARRSLEAAGVDPARVAEVRGYADRAPRVTGAPLDPSNRRISVLLPFITPDSAAAAPAVPGTT